LGRARAELGRAAEGIGLIRQGLAVLLEIEHVFIAIYSVHLAEAQACNDAIAEALETVEQALRAKRPPELAALLIRGQLRFKQGQTELAEADFRKAIALAQKTGAKAWELRATTSLARLFVKQNKRDEARAMLGEIYGWFTEGFDTADLKDAKALLDELNE
jgi:predicted ATPase